MILYGIAIFIGMALTALFNALFAAPHFGFSITYAVLATIIHTVAVIAVDGVFAFIIRRLPSKAFGHERKFFNVSLREKNFYEKRLGIKKWKDKIPELGGFTNFSKGSIDKPRDNEYLARYLLEADYGQIIHLITAFTGFLIIFICPLEMWYCFALPVAAINAILNIMPFFVLRYNSYKLKILFRKNERQTQQSTENVST